MKLSYEEYGNKSDKPPLILLHGFFASSRNWRQIAKRLSTQWHVFVLDIRNHGASPHSPDMDYQVMADDLENFLDQQNIPVAHVLGHSMGGKIAMWFALNHPQRINQLIIADISPVSYQHNFDQTIQALKQLPLEQLANRKQADMHLSSEIPELAYRQFLLQNLQLIEGKFSWRINVEFFYKNANNIVGFPLLGSISPYENAASFIMAGNSNYLNRPTVYAHFPQAEISVLDGASHWLHVDKADVFYSTVVDILKKN